MPFTFSHPAIILPLQDFSKNWFSLTGLVVGSLTPDFEYFIRMQIQSNYSHTLYGIFWFDLPLAILLSFAFHNFIRNTLFTNTPNFIKSRLFLFTMFNWNYYFKRNWIIVILSIIIGIASHLFWDSFTHQHGYFVEHISILNNNLFFLKNKIPIWKIAQHLSTLIGAIIIIIAFLKLPKNTIHQLDINKRYWAFICMFTLIISILRFSPNLKLATFGNIIVTVISALVISLIVVPVLIKFKVIQKN